MKMKRLPSGWQMRCAGDLACNSRHSLCIGPFGSDLKTSDYKEKGVPIVFVKNISPNLFVSKDSKFVSEQKAIELAAHTVRPGDLVVTKMGLPPCVAAVYPEDEAPGIVTADIIKMTVDPHVADVRFVARYLNSDIAKEEVAKFTCGVTRPKVTLRDFKSLPICLPPLSEQKRIVGILDQADGLRRKRQQALALTDQFLRSTFLDLFDDPVTNPKRWPTQKVRSLCDLVRGSSPRPKADPRYYGGTVPRLMVADMTRDGYFVTPAIDTLTIEGAKLSRPVPAGTIVMAVSGNVGVTAQLQVDACVHDGFVAFPKLKTEIVTPTFLMICLDLLRITHETRKAGAIFQNLTTDDIKGLDLPIPPHDRQELFERVLIKHTATVQTFRRASDLTDRFFNSLVQRAFRGDL